MSATHVLKAHPLPFEAVWDGRKPYEIRVDDRHFQAGDVLVLKLYDPDSKTYGAREIEADVTYKTRGGEWGLPAHLCVLGLGNIRRIHTSRPAPPRHVAHCNACEGTRVLDGDLCAECVPS